MEKNSVWYLAGICLIGVVIGIIFVGVLTSVVHWAGTESSAANSAIRWTSLMPPIRRAITSVRLPA